MRFLADAQLPSALARWLTSVGHEADHVGDRGLWAAPDAIIWEVAGDSRAVIVTKGEDFAIRKTLSPEGPPVVWVRSGNSRTRELLGRFERLLPDLVDALARGEGLVEIV